MATDFEAWLDKLSAAFNGRLEMPLRAENVAFKKAWLSVQFQVGNFEAVTPARLEEAGRQLADAVNAKVKGKTGSFEELPEAVLLGTIQRRRGPIRLTVSRTRGTHQVEVDCLVLVS